MSDEPEISSDIEKNCLTCTAHTGAFYQQRFYFRYTAGRHGASQPSSWQCIIINSAVSVHDVLPRCSSKTTLGQTFYSVAGFSLCNNLAKLGHVSTLKCHI